MKKKFICLTIVAVLLTTMTLAVNAVTLEGAGYVKDSWATANEGILTDGEIYPGYIQRTRLEQSLYEADSLGKNDLEDKFTGIGYFPEGVTYTFDVTVEDKSTIKSHLVKNPDANAPDLSLREITWDGDTSKWIGEGVEVYAVNYNGTGEDKLIAYAYNKTAQKRIDEYNTKNNTTIELKQVEGTRVEYTYPIEGNRNVYSTDIYFTEEFEYCEAIKLVDITESLKVYGGEGQKMTDGYDLDAIYGFVINYDIKYGSETAIAISDNSRVSSIKNGKSWQNIVMKVNVEDLKENGSVDFDIIAGQYYKIGQGEIYLDNAGNVAVKYSFTDYKFEIQGEETAKIGIYSNLKDMLDKKGKLLGNGKLTKQEEITSGDAYIRIHFDAKIPEYVYGLTKIK